MQPCSLDLQLSQLEASLAAADAPTRELLGQSTSRWMQAAGAAANAAPGVQPDAPSATCNDVQGASSSKPTSVEASDGQHPSSSTPAQNTSSIDTSSPSPSSSQPSGSADMASSKQATDMQDAATPVPGSRTAGVEVGSAVSEVAASGAGADSSFTMSEIISATTP